MSGPGYEDWPDEEEPKKLTPKQRKKLKAEKAKATRARKKREKLQAEQPWLFDPSAAKVTIETKDGTYQLPACVERFDHERETIDITSRDSMPWRRLLVVGVSTMRFTIASRGVVHFTDRTAKK